MTDTAHPERDPKWRQQGLGASDAAALLNEGDCRRRLWYEKRDPDLRPLEGPLLERGRRLEPLVIAEYVRATGRRAIRMPGPVHHPDEPWWCSLDARIPRHLYGGTPGVLEAKTANWWVFRKMKREGVLSRYLLQLQWALGITGWAWGAIAVLWPDGWELEHVDVRRDDLLIARMQDEARVFARELEHGPGPAQLDPADAQCKRCGYRTTCWGVTDETPPAELASTELELDESLGPHLEDYAEAQRISVEASEALEAIKATIRATLGAREGVRCPGWRIYHRLHAGATRIDLKRLRAEFPKIAELCTVQTPGTRQLRIIPIREPV